MQAAALEIDAEAGNAGAAPDRLDKALTRQSLLERMQCKSRCRRALRQARAAWRSRQERLILFPANLR